MSRRLIAIVSVVLLASALAGGYWSQRPKVKPPVKPELVRQAAQGEPIVRAFADAMTLLDEHYAAPTETEEVTRQAILGMLHELDPHSSFFNRREFSELQDEQNSKFYGIGVTINQRNGRLYVLSVTRGMPAERAGLRYGDAVIAVNGQPALDWSQSDALKHVRGNRGTTVELTIERLTPNTGEPKTLTVQVERDEVPFPSVRNHFLLRPQVGFIALTGGFNHTTSEELEAALEALKAQGMEALVLDLRRNTGGLLPQAIRVAEFFLPENAQIVAVQDARATRRVYRSDNATPETMPLVILIDRDTASASEIVAGALQDQDRAWIVGTPSFGKGLVQTVFRMPSGTGLTLTTSKYFTASGRSIQRDYHQVGYYDYYAERRAGAPRKLTPALLQPTPTANAAAYFTPTHRTLYSGGGIVPDKAVNVPETDWLLRDACFEFVRYLSSGALAGFSEYVITGMRDASAPVPASLRFPITESLLAALREYLRVHPALKVSEAKLASKLDEARRRLQIELLTAAYGIEIGERFLLETDAQVITALAELPQARALQERVKLLPPSYRTLPLRNDVH